MNNINILVEAKKEYTNQLQKILTPRLYEGFKSIYEDIINILSKELEENKTQSSSLIKTFQKMLKEIPQWNQEVIKTEYLRIEKLSNCDYFDNLIEAVFITNTKILTSVQINESKSLNIKISVPQSSHFIHKCYIECSREIYKNPYIFDQSKNLTPKERHNNLREILHIIDNSINNAIRDLLPIRDILKQGLTKNNKNINDLSKIINKETEENKETESTEENKETELTEEIELNEDEEEKQEEEKQEEDEEEDENKEEDKEDENKEDGDKNKEDKEKKDINKKSNIDKKYTIEKEIPVKNIKELIKRNNTLENNLVETKNIIDLSNKEIVLNNTNNETKEIIYNKVIPSFVKNLKNIEKIDDKNKEFLNKESEKKVISPNYVNKPFVKKIKNKFFFKNKYGGLDKNNSFYKKKYEENSANYNSISNSLKNTLQNTILTNEKNIFEEKIDLKKDKIVKNKIMLDINSSDEEISDNVDL